LIKEFVLAGVILSVKAAAVVNFLALDIVELSSSIMTPSHDVLIVNPSVDVPSTEAGSTALSR